MGNQNRASISSVKSVDVDTTTKEVEVNGRTFPLIDKGSGPVVFLIHGFPDSRRLWRHQVPALTNAGFRVVAPDMRGFGDAPKPEDVSEYSVPTVVDEDVIGIMDALDIQSARVVGHDWGASVAWYTAGTHPERVDQLVALSAGAFGNSGYDTVEQLEALWHIYFFQFDTAEKWLQAANWKFFREWCVGGDDVGRYIKNLSRPGALTAGLNWYRANIEPEPPQDGPTDYSQITCPTLGVLSGGDVYMNEPQMRNSVEKIDLTKGSWRYEFIEDASHWIPTDAPVELNKLLVDFLEKPRQVSDD